MRLRKQTAITESSWSVTCTAHFLWLVECSFLGCLLSSTWICRNLQLHSHRACPPFSSDFKCWICDTRTAKKTKRDTVTTSHNQSTLHRAINTQRTSTKLTDKHRAYLPQDKHGYKVREKNGAFIKESVHERKQEVNGVTRSKRVFFEHAQQVTVYAPNRF